MLNKRTRSWWLWIAPLVLTVAAAYWILPNVRPSAATVESHQAILEPNQPADWQDALIAGRVLQSRMRYLLPDDNGTLDWQADGSRLIVNLPDELDADVLAGEAARIGRVELVEGGTEFLPIGAEIETSLRPDPERRIYQSVLASEHFAAARAEMGRNGRPLIAFVLTPTGADLLAAHTVQQGYYLCLVLDGQVVNCPVIRTPLVERRGVMEFISNVTLEQAQIYAMLLCSGPLPVTFRRIDG